MSAARSSRTRNITASPASNRMISEANPARWLSKARKGRHERVAEKSGGREIDITIEPIGTLTNRVR